MNLRSALRKIAHEFGQKGHYTNDDVVAELRVRYPKLVAEESKKLETLGLKRILLDVDAQQAKTFNPDQTEFFPELAGFPGSVDARAAGLTERKGFLVLLTHLPMKVVRSFASHNKPAKKNISLHARLNAYLDELLPFTLSEDDLFSDVIKRSRGQ